MGAHARRVVSTTGLGALLSLGLIFFFCSLLVSRQKLRGDGVSVTRLRELLDGFNDLEGSFLPSISEIKLKIC